MRLLSLDLPGRYGALLDATFCFRSAVREDGLRFSPICLVGLNGSGKSNVIEALSEIFCFLDLTIKSYGPNRGILSAARAPFAFKIVYTFRQARKDEMVQIQAVSGKAPSIQLAEKIELELANVAWKEVNPEKLERFLPRAVIGYSSGHNETISFPYLRAESFYSEAVRVEADTQSGLTSSRRPSGAGEALANPIGYFIDYEFNALILITNSVFQPRIIAKALAHVRAKALRSFRLRICFRLRSNNLVRRTQELDAIVRKLSECALIARGDPDSQSGLTLDFYVSESTRAQFKKRFADAITLFSDLHRLNLLNSLKLEAPERDYYRSDLRKTGLVPRSPAVPDRAKVFAASGVQVFLADSKKAGRNTYINYSALSDGEHQLTLIFGVLALFQEPEILFLFDEPESHFNPRWRAEFVQLVWDILRARSRQGSAPEMVISTHSPFVVSGCRAVNVFKFTRNVDRVAVSKPDAETYGASFDYLLGVLFDMDALMATMPAEELRKLVREGKAPKLEAAKTHFGSSIEKMALFTKLSELEKRKGAKRKRIPRELEASKKRQLRARNKAGA